MKYLIAIFVIINLNACTIFTSPSHQAGRDGLLPVLSSSNIAKNMQSYANQLVLDSNAEYSTIRTYPYADFTRTGLFAIDPIRVLKVDDTWLQNIPSSFLGYGADYVKAKMAISEIKISPGTHTLLLTGAGGGTNEAKYTLLPSINFEAGKRYILKPEIIDSVIKVQIYEYQNDDRFEPSDKDSIIIKSAIAKSTGIGNISPDKIQFPKLNKN